MKRFLSTNSILVILSLLTGIFLAFCKKNPTPKSVTHYQTPPTAGDTVVTPFPVTQVYVFNYHFSPPDVSIAMGSGISWTNRDSIAHTVTSRDGAFDSGDLGPGNNFFFTFQNAGYHSYYCRYHKEGGNITVH